MENIPRKLETSIGASAMPQAPKRSNRWTFLLVADTGKIISIPWLKPLASILVVVLLLHIGATAVLYFSFRQELRDNTDLRNRFDRIQEEADRLQAEKEVLLARAVMAESRARDTAAAKETETKDSTASSSPGRSDAESVQAEAREESVDAAPSPDAEAVGNDTSGDFPISVQNPSFLYDASRKRIQVQIRIVNQGAESEPISGFVFVRLRPDPGSDTAPFTIPIVAATDQISGQYNRGQYFSIARFVTMGFSASYPGNPKDFKTVSVYVFSKAGKLVLQKELPVRLQAS